MKINTTQLALAFAIASGIAWVFCGLVVFQAPAFMTDMTGHMTHMDISKIGLTMTPRGMIMGLVGWIIVAGGFGWILGAIYNLLASKQS